MPSSSSGAAGVPISRLLPAVMLQVLFGASPSSSAGAPRSIIIYGNKTASGSATVDTEVFAINEPDDAKTKGGAGSELHLKAKAIKYFFPGSTLYGVAVTEATGSKATGTITVAGAATGGGTYKITIHGYEVPVYIANGDNQQTQAENIAAAINAKTDYLNVTAAAAIDGAGPSWKVTITAKHNGTRGNSIRLSQEAESTITGTTYTLSGAALSTGTGDDSLTAALATTATSRYHYQCFAQVNTAQMQAVQTQLDTMAGPLVGKRQCAIFANVDTFGNATTLAETLNEERMQGVWMPTAASLPCVIAAAWCGRRAAAESDSISSNLSIMSPDLIDLWPIVVPQKDRGDWITDTEAEAALQVGLTPVQVRDTDSHPFVPLSITTHSNDASGNPDTRTLTTNYQAVPDAVADELTVWFPTTFPNKNVKPDPADGTLDGLPGNVTTPNTVKSLFKARVRQIFDAPELSHLHDLDADYANWAFNVATGAPNRINATIDITPAAWLTQVSGMIRQQTPGA